MHFLCIADLFAYRTHGKVVGDFLKWFLACGRTFHPENWKTAWFDYPQFEN